MIKNRIQTFIVLTSILLLSSITCFSNHVNDIKKCVLIVYEGEKTVLHLRGLDALKSGDTTKAVSLFKESIRKNDDAASYFQLAKIFLRQNSFQSRNLAYENFRSAALKEPDNLEYRFSFANLMKDFARVSSFGEYKKILEMDSSQVEAWLSLGEMKASDYNEYNKSVRMMDEFYGSLQEFADEDFRESENYFKKALTKDSLNYDALLNLSLLYEKAGRSESGIPLLQKLVRHKKDNKDIHLCIGLLYYKTHKLNEAHSEYQKAIELMNEEEKNDFVYNSVKMMLQPSLDEEFITLSKEELNDFFETYWKASDPLYLTDYNERLLEHYSRVAYANLNYSVPTMGIVGWKSNMGETVVRYGEPLDRIRIRPQINDKSIGMKTEVWQYSDMTFAFTDLTSSGNFQFAWPASEKDKFAPQVPGNYHDYAEYLRAARPTFYTPKFEGPQFNSSFTISQFKSSEHRNQTDLYLSYEFPVDDSLFEKESNEINYKLGFYFFDENYYELLKKTTSETIIKTDQKKVAKNIFMTAKADSGTASFEIIRECDNGVSSNRIPLRISKFNSDKLDISEIIFASDISNEKKEEDYFNRGNVAIKPKFYKVYSKSDPLYIYCEIYNLLKDDQGLTNFEQSITISEFKEKKSGLEKIFSSVIKFLGLSSEEKITLTSNYKTFENDPQIYLQLDFSKYEPGQYDIRVKIIDNIGKSEISTSKEVELIK